MFERDVDRESELVEAGASLIKVPVSNGDFKVLVKPPVDNLNEFSDRRAGARPIRDVIVADGDREAKEELADCRSYLAWVVLHGDRSMESNELRVMALGHVAAAFYLIELADAQS